MTAGFEDDVFPQQQHTKIAYVIEPTSRSPDVTIQTEESTDQQVKLFIFRIENVIFDLKFAHKNKMTEFFEKKKSNFEVLNL